MVRAAKEPRRVAFGPFEVNTDTGELTKNGVAIRLAGQPLQILLVLLSRPGEVVGSDELRQKLWGDGTFVDFEHGLHAAINKLRRALNDTADGARYIETVAGVGYRFVCPLAEIPPRIPERVFAAPEERKRRWPKLRRWLAAMMVCVTSLLIGWQIHRWSERRGAWKLSQLTSDAGLSYTPAISRDGTLVAYASDRNGPGQLDLYVKQVRGDDPLRLTFDGLGNRTPDFSPDGSKIVFRSNRDGGGIYEIPTLGGQARLVAKEGQNPKFSPDGSQIVYWIGGENLASAVPGSGTVWVAPVGSGEPRQVGTSFTGARYPIWSPDGRSILMVGYTSSKAYERDALDWWLVSLDGKSTVKTDMYEPLVRARLQGRNNLSNDAASRALGRDIPNPACWSDSGAVIFSAQTGDTLSLWQTDISPVTGKTSGDLKRLTVGAANEWEPSCGQDDRIAFTSMQVRRNVWLSAFDLNAGEPKGVLEQVTKGLEREEHAALDRSGRYLAFAAPKAGTLNVWLHDLASGKERQVAESPWAQRFPVINASGSKVAYSFYLADGTRSVYIAAPGGTPEEVCHGCLRATDWSGDEKSLLVFSGNPYVVSKLDIASRKQTVLLRHEKHSLLYARYSPDDRWISFTARVQPNHAQIMVAPVDEGRPVPESKWIKIADEGSEDWANWSPDGRTVYFTSARDGHFCLWGQRLDPDSRRPVGEPFAALHLHGTATYQQGGWSAAHNRVAMVLTGDWGNVWLLSHSDQR